MEAGMGLLASFSSEFPVTGNIQGNWMVPSLGYCIG